VVDQSVVSVAVSVVSVVSLGVADEVNVVYFVVVLLVVLLVVVLRLLLVLLDRMEDEVQVAEEMGVVSEVGEAVVSVDSVLVE